MGELESRALLSGLAVGESPRWHEGRLWFAHWGTGEIVTVDPAASDPRAEVALRVPTTIPFSIDWLPDRDTGAGSLLVVSGREHLLLRQEPDGTLVTHADLGVLSPLPWNPSPSYILLNKGIVVILSPALRHSERSEESAFRSG